MKKPHPKSNAQIRRLFALAKPFASDACMAIADYLRDLANHVTNQRTASLADLTFDEANAMIKLLHGEPFSARGNSVRMQNYRKQQAGIKTIETPAQLNFIDELARLRGMSPEGLERLANRMRLPWPPQTTEQGNKIVEALKAMNRRDQEGPRSKVQGPKSAAEPKFRRVA